jgi:glycosyltransferase involved in cell wall biosynthesis
MRILIITQYFWPESFRINDLCLGLKERGNEVVVLTGKPNYPNGKFYDGYYFNSADKENWNGIEIYRSRLIPRGNGGGVILFFNYVSFALFASLKVFFINREFDRIFVYEPSPITVGIPAIVSKIKFKSPIYFWVQDLWPESISAAGGVKNKFIIRILDSLTRFIYKQSKIILVQSLAFKPYINAQNVEVDKIVYFPNSTEGYYQVKAKDPEYEKRLPAGFNLIFAGNIGEAQSFDTLLEAAFFLKKENIPINWIILGDGRAKEYVKKKISELHLESNFILLGSFPSTEMPHFFSCADALIVSLKKDKIFSFTIPAKLQSYLACGKPIIGSLDGEGARIIMEANAGFSAPSENYIALADCVRKMYHLSVEERLLFGSNARNYFEQEFEREKLLDKLESMLVDDLTR